MPDLSSQQVFELRKIIEPAMSFWLLLIFNLGVFEIPSAIDQASPNRLIMTPISFLEYNPQIT